MEPRGRLRGSVEQKMTSDFGDGVLRMQRDVLHSQTSSGVLFYSATSVFELKGKSAFAFFEKIQPHLLGSVSYHQLTANLAAEHRARLDTILHALHSHDFIR